MPGHWATKTWTGQGTPQASLLWGCLIAAAVYSIGAYLFRDTFVNLLGGSDSQVHRHAVEYLLCTVVAGGVVTSMNTLLAHLIRSEGRSLQSSTGIAIGGVLNIALDPLFMFVILPAGRETLGAALATALSNVATLIYFIIVIGKTGPIRRCTSPPAGQCWRLPYLRTF